MDMQMPIMNGVEATKAIRALPDGKGKAIPIIAVTADAFAEDMAQALASGMNDYLTKPVDFPKLLHLLHKYI
jgi:CheY-like chemotaxis protein